MSLPAESSIALRVGAVVFESPDELRWLESVLHPLVGARIAEWVVGLPPHTSVAVVEVPLLFETGMEAFFDATIAVVADDAVRAERAAARGTELFEGRAGRQLSGAREGGAGDLRRSQRRLAREPEGAARGAHARAGGGEGRGRLSATRAAGAGRSRGAPAAERRSAPPRHRHAVGLAALALGIGLALIVSGVSPDALRRSPSRCGTRTSSASRPPRRTSTRR